MIKLFTFLFFFVTILQSNFAQNKYQTEFDSLITANTYFLEYENKDLSGEGLSWLVKQAEESQYFLVGEIHGTADVAEISTSLFPKLVNIDYHFAALEYGEFASKYVENVLREYGADSLKSFFEDSSKNESIAFLNWEEELNLSAKVVELSPIKENVLWGLDQEHIFGLSMYIDILKNYAKTDEQKTALSNLELKLKKNKFFLAVSNSNYFNNLKEVFAKTKNNYAVGLLNALINSNYIYSRFKGEIGRAESNVYRENLMKKNFVKFFKKVKSSIGKNPKVFFKFGGFHSAPNIDNFGRISLGTFIEEWALSRNEKAFNILFDANGGNNVSSGQNSKSTEGKQLAINLIGNISQDQKDSSTNNPFSKYLINNDEIFLLDLRPLRKYLEKWDFLSASGKKLISGFDAYLVIPNVRPSTIIESKK